MPLPLIALPIAAGVAAAGAGAARYAGARAQANGMMPEGYADQLADLERRRANGGLGLTESEVMGLENQAALQRGGMSADAQARQLQQAQMLSGQGASSGRDLFMAELATQQAQAGMFSQQARQIQALNDQRRLEEQQMLMELQQREASAEAARKQATATFVADLVGVGASVGIGVAGTKAAGKAQTAMLEAQSKQAYTTAAVQYQNAQMAQAMGAAMLGIQMPAAPMMPGYSGPTVDEEPAVMGPAAQQSYYGGPV